jgi:hypothetical protein
MASITSCKKDSKSTPDYGYIYKGVLCTNNNIAFSSDASVAGLSHEWNFGDGQTSMDLEPKHRFADSGTYLVTLTVNGDASKKVSKAIKIVKDPGYTSTVAHSWYCSQVYVQNLYLGVSHDTTIYGPDQYISISYLDPITVIIETDTLYYDPSTSAGGTVVYFGWHPYPDYRKLSYDIGTNSIEYKKSHHYGASGNNLTTYKSK